MQFRRVGNHPFFTPPPFLSVSPLVGASFASSLPFSPALPTHTSTHTYIRLFRSFSSLYPRLCSCSPRLRSSLALTALVLCLYLRSLSPSPSLHSVLFLLWRWKRAYARARAKVCQKPFCSDRKNGTHCLLTCESALMAKVCEIIVNRDYIRENNAARFYVPLSPLSLRERTCLYASTSTYIVAYTRWRRPRGATISSLPSLFLFRSLCHSFSLRRENTDTHTHTQRWQPASRVSVHTGVCIHTRETAPGSRIRVKKTLVRASASSSCRTGRGRRYFFYVQRERVQGETCIRLARLRGWRRGIEGRQGEHRGYWWKGARRGVAWVDHPLPSIFRGFFLRATALACLDERTRGGTSIIYNQTADKATIALLWMFQ